MEELVGGGGVPGGRAGIVDDSGAGGVDGRNEAADALRRNPIVLGVTDWRRELVRMGRGPRSFPSALLPPAIYESRGSVALSMRASPVLPDERA